MEATQGRNHRLLDVTGAAQRRAPRCRHEHEQGVVASVGVRTELNNGCRIHALGPLHHLIGPKWLVLWRRGGASRICTTLFRLCFDAGVAALQLRSASFRSWSTPNKYARLQLETEEALLLRAHSRAAAAVAARHSAFHTNVLRCDCSTRTSNLCWARHPLSTCEPHDLSASF